MREFKAERGRLAETKIERERERETCLRIGDSFVLCLCISVWECWGL